MKLTGFLSIILIGILSANVYACNINYTKTPFSGSINRENYAVQSIHKPYKQCLDTCYMAALAGSISQKLKKKISLEMLYFEILADYSRHSKMEQNHLIENIFSGGNFDAANEGGHVQKRILSGEIQLFDNSSISLKSQYTVEDIINEFKTSFSNSSYSKNNYVIQAFGLKKTTNTINKDLKYYFEFNKGVISLLHNGHISRIGEVSNISDLSNFDVYTNKFEKTFEIIAFDRQGKYEGFSVNMENLTDVKKINDKQSFMRSSDLQFKVPHNDFEKKWFLSESSTDNPYDGMTQYSYEMPAQPQKRSLDFIKKIEDNNEYYSSRILEIRNKFFNEDSAKPMFFNGETVNIATSNKNLNKVLDNKKEVILTIKNFKEEGHFIHHNQESGYLDDLHAVLVIGRYSDGYIIQNSWGDKVGTKGFYLLPYTDAQSVIYQANVLK